jgi:DNA-binding CsgD family transcriptional regulator
VPSERSVDEREAENRRRERDSIRARLRVAADLAIGNHVDRAQAALTELNAAIDRSDEEMAARYHFASALLLLKRRSVEEAFETFELGLAVARRMGDEALIGGLLTNYGTALVQDGSLSRATTCLEEYRRMQPPGARRFAGLLSLIEAIFAGGDVRGSATLLHELYDRYVDSPGLISAAAVAIPVGLMVEDPVLLEKGRDPALLDLAFSRGEQWLAGPLVESFCMLYEHLDLRAQHDALLQTALESMTTADNSLQLAVRAARCGDARMLPRLTKLVARDCPPISELHLARQYWFDATLASRRGRPAKSRKLSLQAAGGFARTGRPILQAAALASAHRIEESDALLRSLGAVAVPRVRWNAAPVVRVSTGLTAREFEVAVRAADGLSNRAIAEALGVSERTVHRHCEAIFGKLGIHSRWQLGAELRNARNRG